MNKTIGIMAHVDAGKTTFSEQLLYHSGAIRRAGRVDHRDAFLDCHAVERERGITVFSDSAVFDVGDNRYFWVDTPGHADFTAELERALPVLDYAVLVVSCAEGVESHTETVWQLLTDYAVPTMVFINKMDQAGADFDNCLSEMRRLLSADLEDMRGFNGVEFDARTREAVAERDEALLERLLAGDYEFEAWRRGLSDELRERQIFPVLAGAALTGEGIEQFLREMDAVTDTDYEKKLDQPFGARVFKLRHDAQGARQTILKLEQGSLRVRDTVEVGAESCKVTGLFYCHGEKLTPISEARAGELVCATGLTALLPGEGVGALKQTKERMRTNTLMSAAVTAPPEIAPTRLLQALRMLEEEDPVLAVTADGEGSEIRIGVMGSIQIEILARILRERFGIAAEFGPARIVYRETIAAPVVGIGHYEPLKHYAEVWLRLVPTERGSGVSFVSRCHVDDLALNWQRLIETHVFERPIRGVLTGAELTDVRVELIAGRAHIKHTEGGDFRQSTRRALRNALMQAQSVLLEPVVRFQMRVPAEVIGRVNGDLSRMRAQVEPPLAAGDWFRLTGECTLRAFAGYPEEFRAAARGRGSIRMQLARYAPAADAEELIREANYNPLAEDTPDSVFCAHGAGYAVKWDEVRACAHCEPPQL